MAVTIMAVTIAKPDKYAKCICCGSSSNYINIAPSKED